MHIQFVTDLKPLSPPEWFTTLSEEHPVSIFPHITLTQARNGEEDELQDVYASVKAHVEELETNLPLILRQSGVKTTSSSQGSLLMLGLESPSIRDLQEFLVDELHALPFLYPERKNYDLDYWPHATVAQNVPAAKLSDLLPAMEKQPVIFQVTKVLCLMFDQEVPEQVNAASNHHILLP